MKSEINTSNFLHFFSSKNFLKKCNGIRFARSDDRSEVGMCVEWDVKFYLLIKNQLRLAILFLLFIHNINPVIGSDAPIKPAKKTSVLPQKPNKLPV